MKLSYYLLYVAIIIVLLMAVWLVNRRRLIMEADYRRRLESEVRQRTQELADSNRELKDANDKLLEASLTDPLTGLRNRRFLFEEVSKNVDLVRRWYDDHENSDSTEPFNIIFLMIDLDHFKPINDRCGHAAGDEVLLQVRDVLTNVCRRSDFVIRWGGDEFVVVSRNARADQIENLAERLRSEIGRKVYALDDGQIVRITASIGYACYPFVSSRPELMSWEQVLGLADSALYLAKKSRNAWIGYFGVDAGMEPQRLFNTIRNNPSQAQADGHLEIRGSFAVENFVSR